MLSSITDKSYCNSLKSVDTCGADMQKFPLRMKDNDLLVTELYKDPSANRITALSVYLTQKASQFLCIIFYFDAYEFEMLRHITVLLHLKNIGD